MENLSTIFHDKHNKLLEVTRNNHNKAMLLSKLIYMWQISKFTLNDEAIWFTRSRSQIASEAKLSIRSLDRYLNEFTKTGLIEKVNRLCGKKRLYIRITEKLINIVQYPSSKTLQDLKEQPASATLCADTQHTNRKNLVQNGKIDPAKLAVSIYKDKDLNFINDTVSAHVIVDKHKNTPTVQSIYPTYAVEKLIGERIDERSKNYIKAVMQNLQEQHGVKSSSSEQIFAEIVFTVTNSEQLPNVQTFEHRMQIIAKLMRERRWKTPKGFFNHADYANSFKPAQNDSFHLSTQKNDAMGGIKQTNQLKIKRIVSALSEIDADIATETNYLKEIKQNTNRVGATTLIDIVEKKLAALVIKRNQMQSEYDLLAQQDKPKFIEEAHQQLNKDYQLCNLLQQNIEHYRQLATDAFEIFCEASQKGRGNSDKLYNDFELAQKKLTDAEKQLHELEDKLYRSKAA